MHRKALKPLRYLFLANSNLLPRYVLEGTYLFTQIGLYCPPQHTSSAQSSELSERLSPQVIVLRLVQTKLPISFFNRLLLNFILRSNFRKAGGRSLLGASWGFSVLITIQSFVKSCAGWVCNFVCMYVCVCVFQVAFFSSIVYLQCCTWNLTYLYANKLACRRMLAEDTRLRGQKQRTLFLTVAITSCSFGLVFYVPHVPRGQHKAFDGHSHMLWVELLERGPWFGDLPLSYKKK